jgi:hypothetical protein
MTTGFWHNLPAILCSKSFFSGKTIIAVKAISSKPAAQRSLPDSAIAGQKNNPEG